MRPLLVVLLVALASAAVGCDGDAKPEPGPPVDRRIVVTEPADATLDADRDSLVVDLTTVFRHAGGIHFQELTATTPTGPTASVVLIRRGETVVVRPRWTGTATVALYAAGGDGTEARTSFSVTVTVPDRIEPVLAAPAVVEVIQTVPQSGPALRSLFRHLDGRPLAFTVASSSPSLRAEIRADTVRLFPTVPEEATVTVTASDRGFREAVTLPVHVRPFPCPAPAAGQADFFPARDGDVWRFAYATYARDEWAARIETWETGTATWTLTDRGCPGGVAHHFEVAETRAGEQTQTAPSGTSTTPVTLTRTFALTFNASSLQFEGYPLWSDNIPTPSPAPASYLTSSADTVRFSSQALPTFGGYGGASLVLSRQRGLVTLTRSYGTTHGRSFSSVSLKRTD